MPEPMDLDAFEVALNAGGTMVHRAAVRALLAEASRQRRLLDELLEEG